MKKIKMSSLFAIATLAVVGSAHAGFSVEESDAARQDALRASESRADQLRAGLAQMGAPSGPQPIVRGMAKDIPLLTAMKQIVPVGWKAKRAGGLDVAQLVSWRAGGKTWVEVLHDVAVSNGFNAMVDWSKQEITVAPATFVPTGDGMRPSSILGAAVVQPSQKVWNLNTSLTLRENVEAWAKEAGWSVSWAAVDYPVTTKVSLTGVLDDPTAGPLVQLAKAYETAEQPLTFTFYTNKVVRVENASFKQINVRDQLPNHRAMQ